jgi:hypothetical protein
MVKKSNNKPNKQGKAKKQAKAKTNKPKKATMSSRSNPTFGNVATINTAPVAIGNSMRGMKSQILQTGTGVRILGRDFGFTLLASTNITNWVLVGGMPLNPACLPSSALRNIFLMYNQYRLKNFCAHYITSSSTSSTGDIIFYCRRNEGSSLPQPVSSTFLPFVLTDEFTVMGPQWTNHTFCLKPTGNWLDTDYGATGELSNYNEFDLFVYSKTSTTDSPGYVIIDYEFEFKELSLNPRAGIISTVAGAQAQWQQVGLTFSASQTAGGAAYPANVSGQTITGSANTSWSPTNGDIYEMVLDVSNSTFTTPSNKALAFSRQDNGQTIAITPVDGMVWYISYEFVSSSLHVEFYLNVDAALTSTNNLVWGSTATYSIVLNVWVKLVTSVSPSTLQYSQ